MPGRLMSISTTSGLACGKSFSASSAFAYWLTQLKPSARLSTRTSVSRTLSLSSTMETVTGINQKHPRITQIIANGKIILLICDNLRNSRIIFLFMFNWHSQFYTRSAVRAAGNGKFSTNVVHALFHVAKSVPVLRRGLISNATAIVFDFQCEAVRLQTQSNPDFACLRVLGDVIDGLL